MVCVVFIYSPRSLSIPISLVALAKYIVARATGIAVHPTHVFHDSHANGHQLKAHPMMNAHVPKKRVYTGKTTVAKRNCVNRGKNIASPRHPIKVHPAPNK